MGTVVRMYEDKMCVIPESKREELSERMEKLYQAGGMMDVKRLQLWDEEITLISKAKMSKQGMNFCYNYFEDGFWENAGFNNESGHVWSNKVGWSQYCTVIVAAYVLEELYTDGVAVAFLNGEPVTSWNYVGWINYLFGESYRIKNYDSWKLFESVYHSDEDRAKCMKRYCFGCKGYSFISICEIGAVLNGTKEIFDLKEDQIDGVPEKLALNAMKYAMEAVKQYKENSESDKEDQLSELMKMIRAYYEEKASEGIQLDFSNLNINSLLVCLQVSDAPAFIIKAISEIYDKDFWDLWAEIQNIVKRKFHFLHDDGKRYILRIPTMKLFGQSPDDMIPYWEENCDFEFSEELWNWFKILKGKFDLVMNGEFQIENLHKYMVGLMKEADENYYQIYTFTEFYEETVENLNDRRYQALWKLYDEMLHDPELIRAGDVIFVPKGSEYENTGIHYLGKQPKRRLRYSWDIMDLNNRNNKARVTFRRYMALVANKELRCRVFGF